MHEIESPFTAVECMMQKLLWSIVCEPDSRIEALWTVDSIEVLICWQQCWQECWKCCGCPEVGVDRKSWLLCSHLATASPHLQRTQGRQKINYLLLTFTVFTQHLSGHLTTLNPSIVMGLALNVDLDCSSSAREDCEPECTLVNADLWLLLAARLKLLLVHNWIWFIVNFTTGAWMVSRLCFKKAFVERLNVNHSIVNILRATFNSAL